MNRRFWSVAIAFVIGAGFLGTGESRLTVRGAELRMAQDQSTLSILDGDRPLLRYRYTDVPMKPCVDQLFSPAGVQVLRDSPQDHKHHHALMFAVFVDGVNFWEELPAAPAVQQHRAVQPVAATVRAGLSRAGLVQELDWLGPGSDQPLMVERRSIDVLRAADFDATLIEWRCSFRPPAGKESMTLKGNHYHGLGMRFVASADSGGRFFNADDMLGEIVRGDERLTPTKWCAFTGNADGKPVTVALFDHPQNPRYPAKMFTMAKPFAYLSATRNEWKEPLVVMADKPLKLAYGVAVWDGEIDKPTVERLYQSWLKLSKTESEK